MGIFDGFLKQLATGDQIKDFKHASRLYVDNNYALSPKYDWLYHVYFDLDPTLTKVDRDRVLEAGMLVKQVDLPKYTIDTKTFNMYNRPEVVQTKVKYETIQVTFHDDQSDVVRNLWFDYFNHYYRDMDASYADSAGTVHPLYHSKSQYRLGQRDILNNFGDVLQRVIILQQNILDFNSKFRTDERNEVWALKIDIIRNIIILNLFIYI